MPRSTYPSVNSIDEESPIIDAAQSLTESGKAKWYDSNLSQGVPKSANNSVNKSHSHSQSHATASTVAHRRPSKFESSINSLSQLNAMGQGFERRNSIVSRNPEVSLEEPDKPMSSYSRKQLLVLAAVAYGNFWVAACVSLQAPFFPQKAEEKGASATVYGLIFGIYELVIMVMSPIFGKLISVVSPNFLIESGLFVAGSSTILFGMLDKVAGGLPFISLAFAIRVFEGVGAAAFMTASYTVMAVEFPERVATTFALLETCFGLGLIVGPTVGGALYQLGGYFMPFALLGLFLLLGGAVTFGSLPQNGQTPHGHSGNMMKFMGDFSTILDALAIATSLNFIGFNAATLEPHLRQFECTPVVIGSIFVITGAIYALTSPIIGKLCDMGFNEKTIMLIGCVLVFCGSLFIGPFPLFEFEPQLWLIIVSLVIIGLGTSAKLVTAFVDSIKHSIKHRGFPDDMTTYGMVSAMFFSSCSVGAFIGPSMGGYLLDHCDYRWASTYIVAVDFLMIIFLVLYKCADSYRGGIMSNPVADFESASHAKGPLIRKRRVSSAPGMPVAL